MSAEHSNARTLDETLDLDGDWEIRATVYRNGRRIATADALGGRYGTAVQTVVTHLERRDIAEHHPRPRTRT